jgi:dTDP-4-amino-4,6-dideoxygalactose transaminase
VRRTRRQVFDDMRTRGIGVTVHYIPVYRQPYYRRLGFTPSAWPEAERYYAEAITIPLYTQLTPDLQDAVVAALRSALAGD